MYYSINTNEALASKVSCLSTLRIALILRRVESINWMKCLSRTLTLAYSSNIDGKKVKHQALRESHFALFKLLGVIKSRTSKMFQQ